MNKIRIIVIAGPTASGKTALGVKLAKRFNGEIVSGDSMQIYRELSVSTAKPTALEMQGVPHHLLNIRSVRQSYSVADFVQDAGAAIQQIVAGGRLPFLVGGTGLYMDALIQNLDFSQQNRDESLRLRLAEQAQIHGEAYMYAQLQKIDPQSAAQIHPHNHKRVLRALEMYYATGQTKTRQMEQSRLNQSPYRPLYIGLRFSDRQALYDRINRRVEQMLQNGLVEEARMFYTSDPCATALGAIGCKELKPYLDGSDTLEHCVQVLQMQTRRYAKRQITWFSRNPQMHWLSADMPDTTERAAELIRQFLQEDTEHEKQSL